MEQSPKQQITELLKKSQNILVVGCSGPTGDSIGSILALASVLKKLGKEATAIVSDPYPENLNFLPFKDIISNSANFSGDFVISVNVKDKGIEKLSYNKEGDLLNIILTPKGGKLQPQNVSFKEAANFDLIVILDTSDIDKVDRIYDRNTDLFFKVPVINIDHHAGNENFGVVNLVDLTATSTAEILTALIDGLGSNLLDSEIATCLLTGIIDDTASYKNVNTTPKSFTVSAQLLAAGARQQEIVDNLFKSRSLNTLKLWGKVLDGLKLNENCIWATLNNKEFMQVSANIEDIYGVINELLATVPEANTVIIFVEEVAGETRIIIRSKKDGNASEMSKVFGVMGSKTEAGLQLMGNPEDIASKFFDRIKNRKIAETNAAPKNEILENDEVIIEDQKTEMVAKVKKEEKVDKEKTEKVKEVDASKKSKVKSKNIFADDEEEDEENENSGLVEIPPLAKSDSPDIGVWRP
ncbi:hypothetical protein A2Y27_03050 [candidate division CPR2 bacterium GWD1_39_7]|nr:MAG: Phosphoesterase RecJ domain protein [candidate division CPR2 bacterium GW2011_GWD1_39_7]OGB61782.1 MAG: hypothetical protein A2Y27_03050 [candidate division CPR2 bacterium GWD1_39_7]